MKKLFALMVMFTLILAGCEEQAMIKDSEEETSVQENQNEKEKNTKTDEGKEEKPATETNEKMGGDIRVLVEEQGENKELLLDLESYLEGALGEKIDFTFTNRDNILKLSKKREYEMILTEDYTLVNELQKLQIAPSSASIYKNDLILLGPEEIGRDLQKVLFGLVEGKKSLYISSQYPYMIDKFESIKKQYGVDFDIKTIDKDLVSLVAEAKENHAYVVIDEATFYAHKEAMLPVVAQGEWEFENHGMLMVVPSDGEEEIDEKLADELLMVFLNKDSQEKIRDYGRDKYETGLFKPIN